MIERLRYIRLPTGDLTAAVAFSRNVLGLQNSGESEDNVRFRSNEHAYSLEFDQSGRTSAPVVGFEVRFEAQLDEVADALSQQGLTFSRLSSGACEAGLFAEGLCFQDHSGNLIELVVRPHNKGRRFFPSRDTGLTGLQRVALRSTHIVADTALWTQALGLRATDYVGGGVYLTMDDAHHRVALHPSPRNGLLSIGFGAEDLDAIMQNRYWLEEHQIRIVFGPGREPTSGAVTLAFEGPEGSVFTLGTEMRSLGSDWRPRQFAHEAASFCGWGSPNAIMELAGGQDR